MKQTARPNWWTLSTTGSLRKPGKPIGGEKRALWNKLKGKDQRARGVFSLTHVDLTFFYFPILWGVFQLLITPLLKLRYFHQKSYICCSWWEGVKKPENFSTQSFTVSGIFYCFARLLKWKSDGINPWKIIGCTVQGVEGLFLTFHSFWKRYHFSIFVPEIVDIEIMGNISLINICTRNKLYFHSYLKRYHFSIFFPEKNNMKMSAKMLLLNICPKKIWYFSSYCKIYITSRFLYLYLYFFIFAIVFVFVTSSRARKMR